MCFHGKASVNSPSPFKHFELRLVIVPLIKSFFSPLVSFGLFRLDFSEDMLSCLWNAILSFSSFPLSFNHSPHPPLQSTADSNALKFFSFLSPFLSSFFCMVNPLSLTVDPISCKHSELSLYNMFLYYCHNGPIWSRLWCVIVRNATTWWLLLFGPKWWSDLPSLCPGYSLHQGIPLSPPWATFSVAVTGIATHLEKKENSFKISSIL